MKNHLFKLAVWLGLLLALPFGARADFTYTSTGSAITITGYSGTPPNALVIPNTIDGLPVTSIGANAFSINASSLYQNLTNVTIPDSVITIGESAFFDCFALSSVTIGNGVTSIGNYAFMNSYALVSVTIPQGVASIGDLSFAGCHNLTAITVSEQNPWYSSVDGVLFNKNQTMLCAYPGGKSSSYTIPQTVTSIGTGAFAFCPALTSVTIPQTVTSIGNGAFQGCPKLTNLAIPCNVTNIGAGAFQGCPKLTSVVIPQGVTSIGHEAFNHCSSLTSVVIPQGVTSIEFHAFNYCSSLTNVCFLGNAPTLENIWDGVFGGTAGGFTVHYYTGATGFTLPTWNGYATQEEPSSSPTVTTDPVNQTVTYNATVTFTAAASGAPAPTVQWQISPTGAGGPFTNISPTANPSAITETLNLPDVTTEENGCAYRAVFTSMAGTCTTAIAILTVPSPFTTETNADQITITGYTGASGAVAIPSTIYGLPVTTIGAYAFYGNAGLTSVTISDSVTTIGQDAFSYSSLTSITLGSSVENLSGSLFECRGLISITVSTQNPWYSSVDGVLFDKNQTSLLILPWGKAGDYTIPGGVTTIGGYGCCNLTSLTIPASVTSIGIYAFSNPSSLSWVKFIGNAPAMASGIFGGAATNFTVHYYTGSTGFTSPTWYGYAAQADPQIPPVITAQPTNLTVLSGATAKFKAAAVVGNPVVQWQVSTTGTAGTFVNIDSATNPSAITGTLTLTNVLTEQNGYAYQAVFTNLGGTSTTIAATLTVTSWFIIGTTNGQITITGYTEPYYGVRIAVSIPKTLYGLPVTSIGNSAFSGNSSLNSVTIGNNVTNIGASAFYNCANLTSVTIPDSVTTIGNSAFGFCCELTNVTIGNSVINIGSLAFYGCSGLTAISVNALNSAYSSVDGVLFDKNQAQLIQCPEGKSGGYTIPDITTNIGSSAFYNCTKLTSVTIPNSVATIGGSAFYNCTGLTNAAIGTGVTNIGNSAFYGCAKLTSVTIPNSVATIGDSAFYRCSGLTNAAIGTGVTSIGNSAFYGCTKLTSVAIPDSVSTIGNSAFDSCSGLTNASFTGNAPAMGSSVFANTASDFTVYYASGSIGFTSPTWNGYPAESVGAAPIVTTTAASRITDTGAILHGTVNPSGATTTAQFEYGLTTAYGSTASVTLSPANGASVQTVSVPLSGLQVGQTYHYRLTANNKSGSNASGDLSLTTTNNYFTRLAWSGISTPQQKNTPIAMTLTAQNQHGDTFTSFADPVTLAAVSIISEPSEATIGTGTVAWNYPMGTYYHDARPQVIYLAGEIGRAGTISSLALQVTKLPGQILNNWTIRLRHTALSEYPASPMWESDWTTVYRANTTITATGWVVFAFSTPFQYDGTNNLMVDFIHDNTSYSTDGNCSATTMGSYRSVTYQTDSSYGDPRGWPTNGYNPTRNRSMNIPNVRLVNSGQTRPIPLTPSVVPGFVNGVWSGNITLGEAGSAVRVVAVTDDGQRWESSPFDVTESAASGFNGWLADHGIVGDPTVLFQQDRNGDGVANGFEYAFGANLSASGPVLTVRSVNGRPVLEIPAQDAATLSYVNLRVLGSTNLIDWTLPVVSATNTNGRPGNCAWFEPAGTPAKAFFKLEAELK
jgi:hypothetical protein